MEFKTAIHIPGDNCFTDYVLESVKDAGFDAVAISFYGESNILLCCDDWRNEIKQMRKKIEDHGLVCVQTHLPCYEIRRSSDEANEEEAQIIERGIEATALLGCKWGAWHPRTDFNHNYNRENGVRDNVRELTRFVKTAEKFDVGIAVENLPVFPDDKEVLFFSSQYEDLIQVVDTLNSPYIGIAWDTGHANLMKFNQADAIREVGKRLKIVHLNNNFGNADVHTSPAIGTVKWNEVMPALEEIGFSGYIAMELSTPFNIPELLHSMLLHHGEAARWLKTFLHN